VDYSLDGPRCLMQPSSLQTPSSYSPKTLHPLLSSIGASKTHPCCVFGQTTEDLHVLRSSLASTREPLGLRVPSVSRPKVVSPTVAPRILGPRLGRGVASTSWAPPAPEAPPFRLGATAVVGEAQSVPFYKKCFTFSPKKQNFWS